MNKTEAKAILEEELLKYRRYSYAELRSMVGETPCVERTSASGQTYQIEVQVFIDQEAKQTLLVLAAIDDGGWSAFSPLCDDFIIAPDGSFVGE